MPFRIAPKITSKVNKPAVRRQLAGEFACTEQTIIRYIKKNDWNGPLTTYGAMAILKELLGLSTEHLLEKEVKRSLKTTHKA